MDGPPHAWSGPISRTIILIKLLDLGLCGPSCCNGIHQIFEGWLLVGLKHDVGSLQPYLLQEEAFDGQGTQQMRLFMGTTVATVIFVDFSLATKTVARGLP